MRIHPSHVTAAEIVERQRLGQDHHDEEWEGVYHVTPAPSVNHQQVLGGIHYFLLSIVASRGGGTVLLEVNVFRENSPDRDYRVPDLVFVAAGREGIIARDGIRGGAPDAIVEILSPRDESFKKFAFYAAVGIPELILVEPEGRGAEVWRLASGSYERAPAGGDGAVVSESLEVSFRTQSGDSPRLDMVDRRDPSRRMSI
ncbi:MAG: hypothetical protein FD180_4133 [Planctomycetota bacterium]|nr:MAG: hypothetical protein FD180_4133 [Planctomycetota bacterium]